MKLRTLLPCAFLAATLSASASFPLTFRDGNNMAPDGGGHMEYAVVDGTKTDTYYGDPLFNEDGSITLTTNSGATGGAAYFRTVKLTEECPAEYTVLAFEYKTNRPINNLVVWKHEIANTHNIFDGSMMTVADDYQTLYAPLDRNEGWGKVGHYFWINTNDPNKSEGWQLTVKNIRLLSLSEAAAECGEVTGDITEDFTLPNTDFNRDMDTDMDGGTYIFVRTGDNPILATSQLIKTLPSTATTFAFEYKLTGHDVTPAVHLFQGGQIAKTVKPATLVGLGEDDPYGAEWKTAEFDLSDPIKEIGFATVFGSLDSMWFQFLEMDKEDQMMWVKNPRWVNSSTSAIEDITVTPERPADDRIFNIMGVECKAPLAPGIYIQNGKKFIVK